MLEEIEKEMTYIELLEADLEKYKNNEPDSPYIQRLEKQIDKYYDSLDIKPSKARKTK